MKEVIIRIVKKALIMVLIQQLLSEYMVVALLFHNKMKEIFVITYHISMTQCKTAVTPLLTH